MISSQRGIALLIVLWVMTILMATVLSFTLMTRAESYSTLAFKDGMERQFLAEAGIERGIAEIFYRSVNGAQMAILAGSGAWKTDGTPYHGRIGNGQYTVRLLDESGKISLNALTDASSLILRNLLMNLGVAADAADGIADSILDWKDADDLHRLNGAENDYYQSLARPYRARNANFEALEELLLVKGLTPEILYGADGKKGLLDFVSIYGKANRINLNAAPREVLTALPGSSAMIADQIIALREATEIKSTAEIINIIGGANAPMAAYIAGQSNASVICSIESIGFKDLEKRGYAIRATVALDGLNRHRYLNYRSPAES